MPRFFISSENFDNADRSKISIFGNDAVHISKSLRMSAGEKVVLCDNQNIEYNCEISGFEGGVVHLCVLSTSVSKSEPSIRVTLFQALPKGDKFELILQKCTELGVCEVVPVISERCISRPDGKTLEKKVERWNRICSEASMQSGRGKVPKVLSPVAFCDAINLMKKSDLYFICYEGEKNLSLRDYLSEKFISGKTESVSFFVGPEGGISQSEIMSAEKSGVRGIGLGKRILRTETAPICVLSSLMFHTGNLD